MMEKTFTKHKNTRLFLATLATFIALLFVAIFSPFSLKASASSYFYLKGVTALSVNGDGVVVSDENGTYLLSLEGENKASVSLALVTDFAQTENALYATSNGEVFAIDFTNSSYSSVISDGAFKAKFLCYTDSGLFVASENQIRLYSCEDWSYTESTPIGSVTSLTKIGDEVIYSTYDGYRSSCYKASDNSIYFDRLSFYTSLRGFNDNAYAIDRSGNLVSLSSTGVTPLTNGSFVTAFYPTDSGIYYATERGEIFLLGENGSILFVASDSAQTGFYSSPTCVISRFSLAYACDYLNNRVAVISSEGTTYLNFTRPYCATVDNAGNLFVAHSNNIISKVDALGKVSEFYTATDTITSLACDGSNALYAVIGGKAYALSSTPTEIATAQTVFTDINGNTLYYVDGDTVYNQDKTAVFTASENILSATADHDGAFYYLTSSALIKRDSLGAETPITEGFTGATHLSISKAKTKLSGYGDLLLANSVSSKVYSISALSAGVAIPSANPVVEPFDELNIVRKTIASCSMYSSPLESEIRFNLPLGAKVLVTKYEVDGFDGLAHCYYEDEASRTLYSGFVFKSNLSEPLVYNAPPAEKGVLFLASASLYCLPSTHSTKLNENMPKGTELTLLPFADYESSSGEWYKAMDGDGKVGFVLASTVSVRGFIPDGIRPQYNGEIISYKDSVGAEVFIKTDNGMQKVEGLFLPVGTKVQVLEPFDSSEKYSKVIFYDEELGSFEAFVKTVYLDYNGFSMVQVIAIVIIVVTVILLGVLLIRIHQKHRKI